MESQVMKYQNKKSLQLLIGAIAQEVLFYLLLPHPFARLSISGVTGAIIIQMAG